MYQHRWCWNNNNMLEMDFSGPIIGNICRIWSKKCQNSEHYLTKTDLNALRNTHLDVFQSIEENSEISAVEQQFIVHQRSRGGGGDLFPLSPPPRCHRIPTAHRLGAQSLGARETLPLTPKSRGTLSEGLTLHRCHCSGVASSEKVPDNQSGSSLSSLRLASGTS